MQAGSRRDVPGPRRLVHREAPAHSRRELRPHGVLPDAEPRLPSGQEVRPDVVIGMQNERFLLDVPYDSIAPTQAELAAAKQAQGKLYGPRTHTATPRVDSFD